jgi:hypothetical protein
MRLPSNTATTEQLLYDLTQNLDDSVPDAMVLSAENYLIPQDMKRLDSCRPSTASFSLL